MQRSLNLVVIWKLYGKLASHTTKILGIAWEATIGRFDGSVPELELGLWWFETYLKDIGFEENQLMMIMMIFSSFNW